MRYSWEFKLQRVNKYKNGDFVILPSGLKSPDSFMAHDKLNEPIAKCVTYKGINHRGNY